MISTRLLPSSTAAASRATSLPSLPPSLPAVAVLLKSSRVDKTRNHPDRRLRRAGNGATSLLRPPSPSLSLSFLPLLGHSGPYCYNQRPSTSAPTYRDKPEVAARLALPLRAGSFHHRSRGCGVVWWQLHHIAAASDPGLALARLVAHTQDGGRGARKEERRGDESNAITQLL